MSDGPDAGVRRVVCALGSNQGDSLGLLRRAVQMLADLPGLRVTRVSAVYRTAPVGGPEQPDYLNAVVIGETDLPARTLLARAQEIERALGRVRLERWGPRTLDIDLIVVGDLELDTPDLTLPHPRAHERAFVLVPWLEADPDAVLPGRGCVADLVAGLRQAQSTSVEPATSDGLVETGVTLLPDARIEPA